MLPSAKHMHTEGNLRPRHFPHLLLLPPSLSLRLHPRSCCGVFIDDRRRRFFCVNLPMDGGVTVPMSQFLGNPDKEAALPATSPSTRSQRSARVLRRFTICTLWRSQVLVHCARLSAHKWPMQCKCKKRILQTRSHGANSDDSGKHQFLAQPTRTPATTGAA
jgi:hypothetical protein